MDYLLLAAAAVIGYLLGSINAAVIISRVFYSSDIRQHGSGNAGATNMLRTFGKKAAAATFIVDFLKGIVAALIGGLILHLIGSRFGYTEGFCIAGGFAIIGHNWPVYFGFRGGKGVLTSLSVMLVVAPLPTLVALLVFILLVAITRYVSLGSVVAAAVLPCSVFFLGDILFSTGGLSPIFYLSLAIAVLLIARHHANIVRLIKGQESKLGQKAKAEGESADKE